MIRSIIILLGITYLLTICSCSKDSNDNAAAESDYVVGAYIYHKYPIGAPIDAASFTHLNYAFGVVNDSLNGVDILSPDFFERCVALKDTFPHLKMLISIGGGNNSKFSRMAADSLLRLEFAQNVNKLICNHGIDGVDFDWEVPGNSFGIPEDTINFVKMIRDVRAAIGPDKILSIACGGGVGRINAELTAQYVDYFNAMCYDMSEPPHLHTPIHRSALTGWKCIDETKATFEAKGVPPHKIVMGMAFYGRGDGNRFARWTDFRNIEPQYNDLTLEWDSIAQVPYLMNADSVLLLTFDNPQSLEIKCNYIKDNDFRGGMYWRYGCDDANGTLRHTVARNLLVKRKR